VPASDPADLLDWQGMDVHDALTVLDLPRAEGYYESAIPGPEDSRVARAVRAFTEAEPSWQAAFRDAIDADRADLLCAWSERVAAMAVRLDSASPLVLGLVGLSVADEAGEGEALLIAPLHRRSAEKLDADASRLFDEAAGLTDLIGARWLREARDSDDQVEDAGYVEHQDEDGFRYLRAAGISRHAH
jgi:hypothetical protein